MNLSIRNQYLALGIAGSLIFTLSLPVPSLEAASGTTASLPLSAPSAVLLDAGTHKIIFAKAPHVHRPPASTTKLMTALVVLEKSSLDRVVRVPHWARSVEPSKIHLRAGERYTVRSLLQAVLINSANDAAEVLGVTLGGSRAAFAEMMNAKARRIGCRDTHFTNASGLPSGSQYSTAYDLALIMQEVRKNSFIVDSLSRKYLVIQSLNGRKIPLRNHNKMLWKQSTTVIGKTGYTRKGRHCFVGRIRWQGREVMVTLLGSNRLWKDLKILLDYEVGRSRHRIQSHRSHWSASKTKALQVALRRAGFSPGEVDGKFGPKTLRSVERFQKHQGLQVDGIVGPQTCRALSRFGLPPETCQS